MCCLQTTKVCEYRASRMLQMQNKEICDDLNVITGTTYSRFLNSVCLTQSLLNFYYYWGRGRCRRWLRDGNVYHLGLGNRLRC